MEEMPVASSSFLDWFLFLIYTSSFFFIVWSNFAQEGFLFRNLRRLYAKQQKPMIAKIVLVRAPHIDICWIRVL